MADDKIIIEFDGDISKLKAKLRNSEKEVSKFEAAAQKVRSGLTQAGQLGAVAFGGLTAAIGGALNEAIKFERITTQFEVLTGSVRTAKKTVEDLQKFSAETPFQFEGISQAAQQLLGFGFAADDLIPKLKSIGDVAAAAGQPINEISLIFGQVAAAGKLTGERLLQFQERAIPIGPAIAKTLGVAESAVKDLVSKGKVDFATFEKAFSSLSENGGFAFEGMIKQSKTLGGLISTVKDNVSLFAASAGKQLLPVAKLLADRFLILVQSLRQGETGFETLTTAMQGLLQIAAYVKASFSNLGGVIGVGLATALEAAKAAISLNFAQAKEIVAGGAEEVANVLKQNNEQLNKDLADIDSAFREARKAEDIKEEEQLKEKLERQKEIKTEAKYDEAAVLAEIQAELDAQQLESREAHEQAINDLTKKKLKEKFDAKREVEKEDIKKQVEENKLRMKEEVRYGKELAAAKALFRSQEVQATGQILDNLATLGRSGNKQLGEIAKTAAITRAIINTAAGVTQALAAYPPPLNFALAASVGAAGAVQIATIRSQRFAKGGMVEGGIPNVDSVPALLQQGEVVAPRKNFEEVIGSVRALREAERLGGPVGNNQPVSIEISFKDRIDEFIEATILENRSLGVGAV